MRTRFHLLSWPSLVFLSWMLPACSNKEAIINNCVSKPDMEAICRFRNPEDMELMPDGKTLLISQMGNMEGTLAGNLVSFDTATQVISTLFPLPAENETVDPFAENPGAENWGMEQCSEIPGPEFSPHGISLKLRNDGRWQLAVVNHGQRESVEMFEVLKINDQFTLKWRGCVIPTDGIYMNDVALTKNGSFVASHMFDRYAPKIFGISTGIWKSQFGINTGYVFEWNPGQPLAFRILEESRGPFINGILLDSDDGSVFANVYAGNEIRKLDRTSGRKLDSVKAVQVDNIAWDQQGFILGVSHTGSKIDQIKCMKYPGKTCGFGFTIIRIDPEKMTSEDLFVHEGGFPMGAATVAVQAGNSLYLGSFSGDRIIRKKRIE